MASQYYFGGLYVWGSNSFGQLGDNTTTNRVSPVQTVSGGTNWKQVSARDATTQAIKTDGTLWGWGFNVAGEIGDGTSVRKSSPVQTVSGGTNWKQVAGGNSFVGAIKTDGTLWMWGDNGVGELGTNDTTSRSSPIQTVSAGNNWKQVSCGENHTAAIKTDGTLWLWGRNSEGQLGTNDINGRSSPIQTVSGGTNWKQVSCGEEYTAAIKTDGTLWLWGQNGFGGQTGKLGTNDTINRSSPIQTVSGGTNWKQVACGNMHTGAIKTDGTLWMWGDAGDGRLGNNSITDVSSPVQTVSGGTNWKQVDCGSDHTAAIKTDGTLWTWGSNAVGTLGTGSFSPLSRSSPGQTVTVGTNWKQVSCWRAALAIADSSEDLLT